MSLMIEIVFPLFFLCLMLALLVGGGCALWCALPDTKRETLTSVLRRVTGTRATRRSGPPIYAVQADGHLLYASGKEDVQDFLWATMGVASRQILQLVDEAHPATLLLTCGNETILLEVSMPN